MFIVYQVASGERLIKEFSCGSTLSDVLNNFDQEKMGLPEEVTDKLYWADNCQRPEKLCVSEDAIVKNVIVKNAIVKNAILI